MNIIFANGPEIRAYDVQKRKEFDVISQEKHIEAVDFDPKNEMVFWVDSYDRKIKRSYMVNARGGEVKMGYPQELSLKGKTPQIIFYLLNLFHASQLKQANFK